MRIEIELPDDDRTEWVLSSLHEHGLRLCNDVTCVPVTSWHEVKPEDYECDRPHVMPP